MLAIFAGISRDIFPVLIILRTSIDDSLNYNNNTDVNRPQRRQRDVC